MTPPTPKGVSDAYFELTTMANSVRGDDEKVTSEWVLTFGMVRRYVEELDALAVERDAAVRELAGERVKYETMAHSYEKCDSENAQLRAKLDAADDLYGQIAQAEECKALLHVSPSLSAAMKRYHHARTAATEQGGVMRETRVQITGTCAVVLAEWDGIPANVCVEYMERQSDPYYTDSETTADIDAETAAQIINVLFRAFPQLQTTPTRGPQP